MADTLARKKKRNYFSNTSRKKRRNLILGEKNLRLFPLTGSGKKCWQSPYPPPTLSQSLKFVKKTFDNSFFKSTPKQEKWRSLLSCVQDLFYAGLLTKLFSARLQSVYVWVLFGFQKLELKNCIFFFIYLEQTHF